MTLSNVDLCCLTLPALSKPFSLILFPNFTTLCKPETLCIYYHLQEIAIKTYKKLKHKSVEANLQTGTHLPHFIPKTSSPCAFFNLDLLFARFSLLLSQDSSRFIRINFSSRIKCHRFIAKVVLYRLIIRQFC